MRVKPVATKLTGSSPEGLVSSLIMRVCRTTPMCAINFADLVCKHLPSGATKSVYANFDQVVSLHPQNANRKSFLFRCVSLAI